MGPGPVEVDPGRAGDRVRPDRRPWGAPRWEVPRSAAREVVRLRPDDLAAASARRFVERRFAASALPLRTVDDVTAVAGELVAMSVRQVRSPLALLVGSTGHGVLVVVHDRSAQLPMPLKHPDTPSAHRSVGVVHGLTCCWGFHRVDAWRQTWAVIPVPETKRTAGADPGRSCPGGAAAHLAPPPLTIAQATGWREPAEVPASAPEDPGARRGALP